MTNPAALWVKRPRSVSDDWDQRPWWLSTLRLWAARADVELPDHPELDNRVAWLERRVAELERRLARLEAL